MRYRPNQEFWPPHQILQTEKKTEQALWLSAMRCSRSSLILRRTYEMVSEKWKNCFGLWWCSGQRPANRQLVKIFLEIQLKQQIPFSFPWCGGTGLANPLGLWDAVKQKQNKKVKSLGPPAVWCNRPLRSKKGVCVVHLDDAVVQGVGVEGVLDVALSHDAQVPNHLKTNTIKKIT